MAPEYHRPQEQEQTGPAQQQRQLLRALRPPSSPTEILERCICSVFESQGFKIVPDISRAEPRSNVASVSTAMFAEGQDYVRCQIRTREGAEELLAFIPHSTGTGFDVHRYDWHTAEAGFVPLANVPRMTTFSIADYLKPRRKRELL